MVLKLNGKTDIPSDYAALSPLHASVADAVRLGADTVGYTLCVGTPAAEADFAQYRQVTPDLGWHDCVLIVSHGNTLRALVKHLDSMTEKRYATWRCPTPEVSIVGSRRVEVPGRLPLSYDRASFARRR